ncbi:DUF4115 domain-containing protein [bacterium]|nr:DUF4115 domain-containing protein [bacterium]
MRELGEYLKQMRGAQGVTLEDIAKATKVNIKYLKALEEGNWEKLPPMVYVMGYIKAYGDYLGADISELHARFQKSFEESGGKIPSRKKEVEEPEKPVPEFTHAQGLFPEIPAEVKSRRKVRLQRDYLFLAVIVILALVVILMAVKSGFNERPAQTGEELFIDTTRVRENWEVTPSEEDLAQEIRLKVGKINPAWAIGRADSLTLTVKANDDTWLLVETDYKRAFKGTIKYKTEQDWRAKNSFYLTIGRPEALLLEINGFPLTAFPATGFPKEVTIDRGNVMNMLEGHEDLILPPSLIPTQVPPDTTSMDSVRGRMDSTVPGATPARSAIPPTNPQ